MRNLKPGTIQSAVQAAYGKAGGLECAASDLGLSISNLSRAIDPSDEHRPGGLGINYVHQLSRVTPEAAIPIAQHFAHLAGGNFIPDNKTDPSGCIHELLSQFSDMMKYHGESHSEASEKPNTFTSEEAHGALTHLRNFRAQMDAYEAFLKNALNPDHNRDLIKEAQNAKTR